MRRACCGTAPLTPPSPRKRGEGEGSSSPSSRMSGEREGEGQDGDSKVAETSFDLIVVGGGPGGYVAAIRAAQVGMKTALVEREHLGGICLNWGCIPTKALLRTSEIYHLLHHLDEFGLSAQDIRFDAAKVVARSRAIAKQLSNGVAYLLRKNKVAVFDGHGRLAGNGRLGVESTRHCRCIDPRFGKQVLQIGERRRCGDRGKRNDKRSESH